MLGFLEICSLNFVFFNCRIQFFLTINPDLEFIKEWIQFQVNITQILNPWFVGIFKQIIFTFMRNLGSSMKTHT